jgi:plasmid stabilization system protein ParE
LRVTWSPEALVALDGIISEINDRTGSEVGDSWRARLISRGRQIEQFPSSGRIVPEFGNVQFRELIERPYRLIYRITADGAEIAAILHGARDLQP